MWNLPMMRNYWRFQSEEVKEEKDLSMASLMKVDDNVLKELKVRVFFQSNQSSSRSSALLRIRGWLLVKSQFMTPQL